MEAKLQQGNKMLTQPVSSTLFKMAIPMMLSMLVQALYNVVDSLYLARLAEGQEALAALTLALPMQMLVLAVAVGTGVGINALLSRELGREDFEKVNKVAVNGIFVMILSYVIFLVFGLFFVEAYFHSQTTNPVIAKMGISYLRICTIFSFGQLMEIVMTRLLQSTGKTGLSMTAQLVAAITNIILDPIFIFVLNMGVTGAAVATVAGQILGFVMGLYLNLSRNKEIKFVFKGFKPDKAIISQIYAVGLPAIIMQALQSGMLVSVNMMLTSFGGAARDTAIAAYGVYYKLQQFIFMPVFGLNNAVIPMVAINYGAGSRERLSAAIKTGVMIALVVMGAGFLALQIFPAQLLVMFNASEDLTEIGTRVIKIISLGYFFTAINIILPGVFQALGRGINSLFVSLTRMIVILIPCAYIFTVAFGFDFFWYAFPFAEGCAFVLAGIQLFFIQRKHISAVGQTSAV